MVTIQIVAATRNIAASKSVISPPRKTYGYNHVQFWEGVLLFGGTRPIAYPRNVLCRPDTCRSLMCERWLVAGPARSTTGQKATFPHFSCTSALPEEAAVQNTYHSRVFDFLI